MMIKVSGKHGFTLIEIIIAIAIISIIAGAIAPIAFQQLMANKTEKTNDEVKKIYEAIMGKPEEGTYGYLGDMGVMPKAVEMLGRQNQTIAPPGYDFISGPPSSWKQPWTNISIGGTDVQKIGWKGPYLSLTYNADNQVVDAFGTRYRLDSDDNGLGDFQVISAGTNRTFGDSDDIFYPKDGIATQDDGTDRWIVGSLSLTLYVNNIRIEDLNTNYDLYFSNKGGVGTFVSSINSSDGSIIVPTQASPRYGLHPIKISIGNESLTFMVSVLANTHTHKDLYGTISGDTGQVPDQVTINDITCSSLNENDGQVTVTWDKVTTNYSEDTTTVNLDRYEIYTKLESATLNHDWTVVGIVGPESNSFTYVESGAAAASAVVSVKVRAVNAEGAAIAWISVNDSESCTFTASSTFICGNNLTVVHTGIYVAPVDKTVTYGTVISSLSGASKCWITQNLGADHRASSATDATEASAGWYWQFNRAQGYKVDGIVFGLTIPAWYIPLIDENRNWTWVNEPCTLLLGTGWRLPTNTEWNNVRGGWSNFNDAYNSVLKLHAAGYIFPNGPTCFLQDRGSQGRYWSSTQVNAPMGFDLDITNSGVTIMFWEKAYGFSVRCLKD
ncbi:MAG: prepilin-type N-terminal cleavage/methylation domain-containing protein [bacterium]